jgi:molybdopterin-synthase adenylyltransferase
VKTLAHEEAFRGPTLLKKMSEQPFVICGCGAVGSNLVDNMVRQGFDKITVIDFDRVEDHNRHTQIWTKRDLGQLKAVVLKNAMFNVRGVTIQAETQRLEATNIKKFLSKGSIVVDGFDNSASRRLVTEHCQVNKIDCLHVGLSEDSAEVIWNESYRVPRDVGTDVCEYPLSRNNIMLAITVATDVLIRFLAKGKKENYDLTLGDFKILPRV